MKKNNLIKRYGIFCFGVILYTAIIWTIALNVFFGRPQDALADPSNLPTITGLESQERSKLENQISQLIAENSQLHSTIDRLQQEAQTNNFRTDSDSEVTELKTQARRRNREIGRLKTFLSELALTHARVLYGTRKPQVLIKTEVGDMLMEIPHETMPVAAIHFMRQVESGFWSHKTFFRAEGHVIQATGTTKDGRYESGTSIPYQEYNESFPHKKYTIGLAGRPGGPDFYVNMMDNIKIHGPGGQGHNYQGDPEADVCFAKLLSGMEVADKIQKMDFVRDGGMHILKNKVEIIEMKLVTSH